MTLRIRLSVILLAALAACAPAFVPRKFTSNDKLFQASLERLQKKKWDDAIAGFEKLTLDLSSRDSLLPLSHWYLAKAHTGRGEHLLAAQEYTKLAENFADDTLADDALFESGRSYSRLWRRPALDPQYGQLAQVQYRLLITLYPDSPRKKDSDAELARLDEWFATKDFDIGDGYFRRKAYDSAIIYFRDIVKNYPSTDKARRALIRMVQAFRSPVMNYKEDAKEVCATLHTLYPADKESGVACAGVAPVAAKPDSTATPVPPAVPAKPAS
ncbi:MAG: outer membrane protein assembly factor BamD [Gemmatimonadaceae bacterium]